ncbi:MAG: OmpA family protein [Rhodoferax sp.]
MNTVRRPVHAARCSDPSAMVQPGRNKSHTALRCAALAWALLGLAGCAQKSYVVLLQDPQGGTGQVLVQGRAGQQTLRQAGYAADLDGARPPAPVDPKRFEADFAAVLAARAPLPERYVLYFEAGGTTLTAQSQVDLARILQDVRTRPVADVAVIGHTDTVGKPDANYELGLQRAQGLAEHLQQQGLQPFSLSVESHGERNPLVSTPDETDEARNRRVEVWVR